MCSVSDGPVKVEQFEADGSEMSKRVTINHITHDPRTDEFVLYLVEDGPWPSAESGWETRLKAIQDRVLDAADVAINGYLAAKYPDAVGNGVRIQVDSPFGSPQQLDELVCALKCFLVEDESYATAIANSKSIRGLRLVTGKEIGRFRHIREAADETPDRL